MVQKMLVLGWALAMMVGCAGPKAPLPPERGADYERIGSYLEAQQPERALEELLETSLQSREERLLLARLLIQSGRQEEARLRLAALSKDYPDDADILYLHYLLFRGTSPENAGPYLEAALAADPGHGEALAARGRLDLEAGLPGQARAAFAASLAVDPDQPEALLGMGELLAREERYPEALTFLDRAVLAWPALPFVYQDRARIRSALGEEAGALEDLDTAVRLQPDDYWSRLDRGRLLLRMEHRDKAALDFERAVELEPDIFLAYVYAAGIHEEGREYPEAIADYETLLVLRPDYFFALDSLGVLYYISEQWRSAAHRFAQAFENSWEEPSYALLAALARRQAGLEVARFLQERLPRIDRDSWAYPLARYLAGEAGEAALLDRVQRETDRTVRARMLFYLGCAFLAQGRSPAGLTYLSEAAQQLPSHWAETRIARELCARGGILP